MTQQDVLQRKELVRLEGGELWHCLYRDLNDGSLLIYAQPYDPENIRVGLQTIVITLLMSVLFIILISYVIFAQKYVRDRILSDRLKNKYLPGSLRVRAFAAGLAGAVVVFIAAVLIQAVTVLHTETLEGRQTVQILFENS